MAVVTLLIAAMVLMFSYTSLPLLSGLDTQTALLIGFAMSKANELAKALFGFKELFLVGFYLTVGMTAVPGWTEVLVALLSTLVLPIKVALYFSLFSLFCLRASTSWRTSLNLANYSEFGLIVCALAASAGWLPKEWLAVFAVMISISFILAAPLVNIRDSLYQTWRPRMKRFERPERLSGEENLDLAHIKVVVFGMERMGTAAYVRLKGITRATWLVWKSSRRRLSGTLQRTGTWSREMQLTRISGTVRPS